MHVDDGANALAEERDPEPRPRDGDDERDDRKIWPVAPDTPPPEPDSDATSS